MKKLVLLIALFFLGNWLLDVGFNAYLINGMKAQLTNGLWNANALLAFHLGWYLSIICFVVLALMHSHACKRKNSIKPLMASKHFGGG